MRFTTSILTLLAVAAGSALALPAQRSVQAVNDATLESRDKDECKQKPKQVTVTQVATTVATASASATVVAAPAASSVASTPGVAADQVVKIGETEAKKIKVNGFFGSPNPVSGGFVFTKLIMPPNAVGSFEPEYNGTAANTITVIPKLASVPPPAGMVYVDSLSYVITANAAAAGDTHKVDYIFTEATKQAVDPTQVTIGKLDAATGQFVTQGVGKFEFEKDENEWSLEVADMNGEWAVLANQTGVLPPKAEEED